MPPISLPFLIPARRSPRRLRPKRHQSLVELLHLTALSGFPTQLECGGRQECCDHKKRVSHTSPCLPPYLVAFAFRSRVTLLYARCQRTFAGRSGLPRRTASSARDQTGLRTALSAVSRASWRVRFANAHSHTPLEVGSDPGFLVVYRQESCDACLHTFREYAIAHYRNLC